MAEETQLPELKRLMEVVIQKVDGLASDVRTNTYAIERLETKFGGLETKFGGLETKVDGLETKVDRLESDMKVVTSELRTLSGQFSDVGIMAIKDHQRIDSLESRVDILEQKPH
jgi:outer membrane murein-binding lipoprotein Lpp